MIYYPYFDGNSWFKHKESGLQVLASPYNGPEGFWVLNCSRDKFPTWHSCDDHPAVEELEFLRQFEPMTERSKNILKQFFEERSSYYKRIANSLSTGVEYELKLVSYG